MVLILYMFNRAMFEELLTLHRRRAPSFRSGATNIYTGQYFFLQTFIIVILRFAINITYLNAVKINSIIEYTFRMTNLFFIESWWPASAARHKQIYLNHPGAAKTYPASPVCTPKPSRPCNAVMFANQRVIFYLKRPSSTGGVRLLVDPNGRMGTKFGIVPTQWSDWLGGRLGNRAYLVSYFFIFHNRILKFIINGWKNNEIAPRHGTTVCTLRVRSVNQVTIRTQTPIC
jgi:hypothetical protein